MRTIRFKPQGKIACSNLNPARGRKIYFYTAWGSSACLNKNRHLKQIVGFTARYLGITSVVSHSKIHLLITDKSHHMLIGCVDQISPKLALAQRVSLLIKTW